MNTSTEAIRHLDQAATETRAAIAVLQNLLVEHDYQDVAALVTGAAAALLEAAAELLHSKDEAALSALERADELLDAVYEIIESEVDEE